MKVEPGRPPPGVPQVVRRVRAGQEAQAANDKEDHARFPVAFPAQVKQGTGENKNEHACSPPGETARATSHPRKWCPSSPQRLAGQQDRPTAADTLPFPFAPAAPHVPEMEGTEQQKGHARSKEHRRDGHGPPWQPMPAAGQRPRRLCGGRGRAKDLGATKAAAVDDVLVGRRGVVAARLEDELGGHDGDHRQEEPSRDSGTSKRAAGRG